MGINPTALYKAFTFGGESSADYGAFLTGEGVFNAPERAVEMIEVPGRNGSFAMDMGRFENVELTYKASLVDVTSTDFADRISALRNWLCSKRGYIRLEDDYNPDEYRMAVYKSGLEVEALDLKAGEFEIVFECKPQRWLKSGETSETITSGDEVDNPTLFDAEPLLEVKGYGGIEFNGYEIDIENALLGDVVLIDKTQAINTYYIDTSVFNNGDTITVSAKYSGSVSCKPYVSGMTLKSISYSSPSFVSTALSNMSGTAESNRQSASYETNATVTFTAGTDSTKSSTLTITYGNSDNTKSVTWTLAQKIQYVASSGTIIVSVTTTSISGTGGMTGGIGGTTRTVYATVDSTVSALGNPTYIDCEIGEAYMIKNGNIVSCNSAVALGSDLPKLAPGTNTITYDNTVTELKIHPRWWRV